MATSWRVSPIFRRLRQRLGKAVVRSQNDLVRVQAKSRVRYPRPARLFNSETGFYGRGTGSRNLKRCVQTQNLQIVFYLKIRCIFNSPSSIYVSQIRAGADCVAYNFSFMPNNHPTG